MTEQNGTKPTFDFSRFSWREAKRVQTLQARANQASALIEEKSVLLNPAAFDDALAKLDQVMAELEQAVARVLVSVPREWLVANAPAEIDWSDPASLDWLQGNRMAQLQTAMVLASSPETVSGN
jgi:hypothetical protein